MVKQRAKTTHASDINETTGPVFKKSKSVRRSDGLRARKESDRLRVKTRINISYCFIKWRKLKEEKNLQTHGDIANYLLNLPLKNSVAYSVVPPARCWNYFFLRAGEKPDKRTAVEAQA